MVRATELSVYNLLSFNSKEGSIKLRDERTTLINVNALAKLRKDMILSLGMERAKGFLTRFGWNWGYNDALAVQDLSWDNDIEWLAAGPLLHTLLGVAQVTVDILEVNRSIGSFRLCSTAQNSYEAELHVQEFGYHDSPVCWTFTGYAGGWGSAFLGKKVIYNEIQCIGRGDTCCTFEGRTLHEWQGEIDHELKYYEDALIDTELEETCNELNKMYDFLMQTVHVTNKLTKIVLEEKGLKILISELADILSRPIIVEDHDLNLLVKAPYDIKVDYRQPGNRHDILNLKSSNIFPQVVHGLDKGNSRIIKSITSGNTLLGFISVFKNQVKFSPLDFMIINQASDIIALELMRQKTALQIEQRIRGDLLQCLIREHHEYPYAIIQQARQIGFNLMDDCRIVIVAIDNISSLLQKCEENELQLNKQIIYDGCLKEVVQAFKTFYPNCLSSIEEEKAVFLIKDNKKHIDNKSILSTVCKRINKHCPGLTASMVIGSLASELNNIVSSYKSAQEGMTILRNFGRSKNIIFCDDLGISRLLLANKNKHELISYMNLTLGALLEYDRRKGSELVPTLEVFFNNECNYEMAAAKCNLTVGGLKYRLKKIEEIKRVSLSNPKNLLDLQLALIIYRLVN